MTVLQAVADGLVQGIPGLDPAGRLGQSVRFFVREIIVIGGLLVAVTHLMGLVNVVLPVHRLRDAIASGKLKGLEHLTASLFGAVTPFCSCSSIPLFIGFLQGGIPLGVTFSFLITSPLVNEVALAVFLGTFGWKVTALYAGAGVLLGTVLGPVLGRLDLEEDLEQWAQDSADQTARGGVREERSRSWGEVLRGVSADAMGIVTDVAPYLVAGLAVGAAVHGWVPAGVFESWLGESNPLAVPAAVTVAVPIYAGASGVIPVVQALVAKGVPLGTALAFMMAVVGLSLPEALMLRKVMRPKLLAVFFGSVAVCIVLVGYGFNLLL